MLSISLKLLNLFYESLQQLLKYLNNYYNFIIIFVL